MFRASLERFQSSVIRLNSSTKSKVLPQDKKNAKAKLSDGHMWFSIFARPPHSSFTRTDRLTCCFVLLFISMLMNIMYYGEANKSNEDGLVIGQIKITAEQVLD